MNIEIVGWLLKIGPALAMVVFGISQMMKPEKWEDYIPESLKKMSPMSPSAQMRMHAAGNIAFGIFLICGWHPYIAAWVAFVWWITILPFAFMKNWAIGLRDLSIILSLLALIFLLR